MTRPSPFLALERFLHDQLVIPVVLSSLLGVAFFVGRALWSGHFWHFFLMWNLFLAWIPYVCALAMAALHDRRAAAWQYVIPSLVWLLFFPNAAYLVTDLANLGEFPPVSFWYDVAFFATMAWTGLLLAVASLQIVQRMVKESFGVIWSWIVVMVVIDLNGVGIYLGRFLRWNSWDVFTDPLPVLQDALTPFLHPIAYRQPVAIMIVFSALLFVCYVSVLALQNRRA
ncbi:MAG: DUF1361 domain-containing protein [Chloroflexi bacterium]|nr:DUF1361 domain-containing protein [Chloroflexota bacterium]